MLIGAQLRAQRARQLRVHSLGQAMFVAPVQPALIRGYDRVVQHLPKRGDRCPLQSDSSIRRRCREVREVVELASKRVCQGHELTFAEFQEARPRARFQPLEQLLEVKDVLFIDNQFASNANPLSRRLDPQPQGLGLDTPDKSKRLALGPLAPHLRGFELLQKLEALHGLRQHERVQFRRPGLQRRTSPGKCVQRLA
ncbi:MAG: hypothetical protein OXS50_05000, partial [Gammaproteobacteria bacterium]|nr:hypothetical protein [Gammaproteobacteria bacterium]